VVVRNIAAGSLCQQTVASGHRSETAAGGVLLQNDQLGDPLLTRDRSLLLLATPEQVEQIQHRALTISLGFLPQMRHYPGRLQTEFGFDSEAQLRLADELAPTPAVFGTSPTPTPTHGQRPLPPRFGKCGKRLSASFERVRQRQLSAVRLKLMRKS